MNNIEKKKTEIRQQMHKYKSEASEYFDFGVQNLDKILPPNCKRNTVVLVEGPRGTFKKTLVRNFLLRGLSFGENVLLIQLHDTPTFDPKERIRISLMLRDKLHETIHLNAVCSRLLQTENNIEALAYHEMRESLEVGKLPSLVRTMRDSILHEQLRKIPYSKISRGERKDEYNNLLKALGPTTITTKFTRQSFLYNQRYQLTELALKSGYILPEELIQILRDILLEQENEHRITRIAFGDIGLLGVSYPLLRQSKTAGDLFLTAFIHIIRNHGDISLVLNGTTGQYIQADTAVSQARALSDTVLHSSFCDVYGNRYIAIEGEGLTTGGVEQASRYLEKEYGEYVPGVIIPHEHQETSSFEINLERLEGLVGFGTANLHRPGFTFRTFEEGDIHRRYNDDIERMLGCIFAQPISKQKEPDGQPQTTLQEARTSVAVEPFSAYDSKVVHDSLDILGGRPINRTVVTTADEFSLSPEKTLFQDKRYNVETASVADRAFVSLNKLRDSYHNRNLHHIKSLDMGSTKSVHTFPYYANVMLLAYRIKDDKGRKLHIQIENYNKMHSWCDVLKFAQAIRKKLCALGTKRTKRRKSCLFEYFDYADETLSCVLLDALVSHLSAGEKESASQISMSDYLKQELKEEQVDELLSLQTLLSASREYRERYCGYETNRQVKSLSQEKRDVSPLASVYLCWYTQLRELIEQYPYLADKLDICSLPGGGFRGDWYVGVVRGSVSTELGRNLIRTLCSKKEEYKRFAQGVGLPTLSSFYDPTHKFFAWPKGEHVKVVRLKDIHLDAWTRAEIPGYRNFRSTLHTICRQLIRPGIEKVPKAIRRAMITENIGRLPTQIKMLS